MKLILKLFLAFIFLIYYNYTSAQTGWQPKGPVSDDFFSLATDGNNIYAGTWCNYNGVFKSNNLGETWEKINYGFPGNTQYVSALIYSDTTLVAGTNYGDLCLSKNYGTNWSCLYYDSTGIINLKTIFKYYPYYFIGTGTGIAFSPDNGKIWFNSDVTGLSSPVNSIVLFGSTLFLGTGEGVYIDNGSQFVKSGFGIPNGENIYSIGINNGNIYAGSEDGIFVSENGGGSWSQINNGLLIDKTYYRSFAFSGTSIFAAATGLHGGVYKSSNKGATWTAINTGFPSKTEVYALLVKDDYLFAGASLSGVFRRSLSEITNTSEVKKEDNMEVYPNPNNGKFTISYTTSQANKIVINCDNILGESIYKKEYKKLQGDFITDLDLTIFPKGIYIVRIHSDKESSIQKVIIK